MEPLLRFEAFEALLRWIPKNTDVYVVYNRTPNPHFRVYKAFAPPPYPNTYEEWLDVRTVDVRLGTGMEAEDWLKRQRRLASVQVIRKRRSLRFVPVHYDEVMAYGRWGTL